jgi:hypothetical protein
MGLFDRQVKSIEDFISEKKNRNQVKEFKAESFKDWPLESSLILEEDTAIELGNPGIGSLSLILWSEDQANSDKVLIVGPDLDEIKEKGVPFSQIVIARGSFQEEFDCYTALRDSVYDTKLQGFMARVMPSRQTVWCRVNKDALDKGLSLAHLGVALIRGLKEIEFVTGVDVIFVTSGKDDMEVLKDTGYDAGRIVGALMKMGEEMSFDCDSCDYREVCDKVEELKMIRGKLKEKTATN